MRRQFLITCAIAALSFQSVAIQAHATNETTDAQALVKKAVAFLKANGKAKAIEEINKAKGPFVKGELYVFVLDSKGVTLANGTNPKIIGINVMDMRDADGKSFIKEIFKIAEEKGSGWLDYKWPDPVTKAIRNKSTYVEKADDLLLCAGIYK